MGIQTAAILYPVNSTIVSSGVGVDIRLLDSAEAGADDDTQTCTATHTDDALERHFDPATANGAEAGSIAFQLVSEGWALRLTEDSTPADDTNCNAVLTAGTLTVNLQATINQAGGTYVTGTYGPTWKASLWRYNIAANTGTLIAAGSVATPTWDLTPATGDLGVFKAIAISIAVAALAEFQAGEVLLLQVGLNTGTIPNPTLGTATWTYTLRVDNTGTNITFAAGQGIRQLCRFALDATGVGTSSQDSLTVGEFLEAIGVGTADESHITAALVTLDAIGVGTAGDTHAITLSSSGEGLEAVGVGTASARVDLDIDDVPTGGGGTTIVKRYVPVVEE